MNLGTLWEWEIKKLNANITNVPLSDLLGDLENDLVASHEPDDPAVPEGNRDEQLAGEEASPKKKKKKKPEGGVREEDLYPNSFTLDYEAQIKKRVQTAG